MQKILGVDFDSECISWAKENIEDSVTSFVERDFLNNKFGEFDTVVSVDVIEYIEKKDEQAFLDTVCMNLKETGSAIIGTPNITMQPYQSEWNNIAHVNMFDQTRLFELFSSRFNNVFIFGMNDEVLHTGYYPMSCYIFALCCNKKTTAQR